MNKPFPVEKIAVVAPDHIGDYLFSTPAVRALRRGYPGAGISLFLSPVNMPAALGNPDVDEMIEVPVIPGCSFIRWALSLRKRKFDLVVCLPANVRKYFLSFMIGGRIGIGLYYSRMLVGSLLSRLFLSRALRVDLDQDAAAKNNLKVEHELEQYLRIPEFMGLDAEDRNIVFRLGNEDESFAGDFLMKAGIGGDDFILGIQYSDRWFTPGTRRNSFVNLLGNLRRRRPSWKIILFYAAPCEEGEVRSLVEKEKESGICLAGALPLKKWASLLSRCGMLLAVDGGAPAVAGALGVPAVVLYPPACYEYLVQRWHPWGSAYRAMPNVDFSRMSRVEAEAEGAKLAERLVRALEEFVSGGGDS